MIPCHFFSNQWNDPFGIIRVLTPLLTFLQENTYMEGAEKGTYLLAIYILV